MTALEEGPWTIEPGANSHLFDARIMAGGVCIAFAEGDVIYDDEGDVIGIIPSPETLAMAAAPDLLEAVIALRADVLAAAREAKTKARRFRYRALLDQADAAITKARGGAA